MDNRTFGYARVSSREQHEDRQLEALTNYGVNRDNIIVDKCSGKDTEREGYQYLKKQMLRNGDTLVIKELDRLSRSKSDIKQELEFFKCNGIHVKILDIPTTLTDFPPVHVPGDRPYREYGTIPLIPGASHTCGSCGLCAAKCPSGAIPSDNPTQTDKDKCISCMRCISVCPTHSRKLNPLMLAAASQKLKKACSGRKENELFL